MVDLPDPEPTQNKNLQHVKLKESYAVYLDGQDLKGVPRKFSSSSSIIY